jgi:two-component system invasion response regulator UvrY
LYLTEPDFRLYSGVKLKISKSPFMVKVAIADDHHLVREAWTLLLSRDKRLSIVSVCDSGDEIVEVCRTLKPDVVLMDINMEPVNGVDATRTIREFSNEIKIIGISVHNDLAYVNALMQAGANGYVTKNSSSEEMIRAIFQIMDGKVYLCKEITDIMPQ